MKKNSIKYLVFSLIVLFSFLLNTKALSNPNYEYYAQSYKNTTMFCIDGNYHALYEQVGTYCAFKKISTAQLGDLYTKIREAGITTDHQMQAALRYIGHNKAGWSKAIKKDGKTAVKWVEDNKLVKQKLDNIIDNIYLESSVGIEQEGEISYSADGKTATVVVAVTATQSGYIQITGGGVVIAKNGVSGSDNSFASGVTRFTIQTPVQGDCEGATLNVTAYGTSYTPGNPGIPDTNEYYYLLDCGYNNQNYIIKISPDKVPKKSKRDPRKPVDTTEIGSAVIDIPDPNCDCSGTSNTFCMDCNEEGFHSSDKQDNLLACAKRGKFIDYCSVSIQKTEGNLDDNPYCKVYCTEDIKYNLPGRIKTKSGRYFKLLRNWNLDEYVKDSDYDSKHEPITITGTRKCFTNKIDRNKYLKDIKEAQESVIIAYNTYQETKAKHEAVTHPTQKSETYTYKVGKTTASCTYTVNKSSAQTYKKYPSPKFNDDGTYQLVNPESVSLAEGEVGTWITDSNCPDTYTNESAPSAAIIDTRSAANTEVKRVADLLKACGNWENHYCFRPEVKFSYDEPYGEGIPMNGTLPYSSLTVNGQSIYDGEKVSNPGKTPEGNNKWCKSVDSNYENCDPTTPNNSTAALYAYADETINTKDHKVNSNAQYIMKTSVGEAKFKESTKEVSTYHPYGTIKAGKCGNTGNCRYIGWVLPVALEHKNDTGIFNYNIKFGKIGVPGNDEGGNCDSSAIKYGRISGDLCENDLASTEKENTECSTDYTCTYETKVCPGCKIKCKCPDGTPVSGGKCIEKDQVCIWEVPDDCPTCKVRCVGCIWENGDTTISYKTISLTNKNYKAEDFGSNWTQEQVDDITTTGETIYDKSSYEGSKKKTYYLIRISPITGGKIRKYNKEHAGYTNDTLICGNDNSPKVICESKFLREFLPNDAKVSLPDVN